MFFPIHESWVVLAVLVLFSLIMYKISSEIHWYWHNLYLSAFKQPENIFYIFK